GTRGTRFAFLQIPCTLRQPFLFEQRHTLLIAVYYNPRTCGNHVLRIAALYVFTVFPAILLRALTEPGVKIPYHGYALVCAQFAAQHTQKTHAAAQRSTWTSRPCKATAKSPDRLNQVRVLFPL